MSRDRRRSPLLDTLERRQLLSITRGQSSGTQAIVEQASPLALTVAPVDPLAGLGKGMTTHGVLRSTSTGEVSAIQRVTGRATFQAGAAVGRSSIAVGNGLGHGHLVLPAGGMNITRGARVASTLRGNVHLVTGNPTITRAAGPAAATFASEIAALRTRLTLHTTTS